MEKREAPALSDHKCQACGKPLIHLVGSGEKGGYNYWKCSGGPECTARYNDDGGRPGTKRESTAVHSEFKCPKCKKPLVKHGGRQGPFFGCSGYPKCKATYNDKDGRPDFDGKKKK